MAQDNSAARRPRQAGTTEDSQMPSETVASIQHASLPFRNPRSEESWIEIESRPSSSSLSSTADEIITTGLRVQHDSNVHRHRRARTASAFQLGSGYRASSAGGSSSQEEYEESESESDQVLTSSNEGIRPSPLRQELRRSSRGSRGSHAVASSESMSEQDGDTESDDDENATAVNYPRSSERSFEPRPNAFSHPPTARVVRPQSGESYPLRRPAPRSGSQHHSYPQHSPYNAISPSYQADHDEALRASLSTLLSAAAAVRGLPKPGQPSARQNPASTQVDPTSLRLVPESVALGEEESNRSATSASSPRATSTGSAPDKAKRKAVPPGTVRSSSRDRKKVRRSAPPMIDEVSPTLFTWVVGAGVVVFVSALSFSAGYALGREAGHAEAVGQLGAVGADAGRCGREAGISLKRLRWSAASGVRV